MRTTGRGRWPCGLLGMLALVVGVEQWVARHESRFIFINFTGWARVRASVGRSTGCRIVVLGDSLLKLGMLPAVLERRLPGPVCNLAVTGGHAPGSYFLLRRLLAARARPRAVIFDGELLAEDPLTQSHVLPELLDLGECAELAWSARDARRSGVLTLSCLLPTYRTRVCARAAVLDALRGIPPDAAAMLPSYERNWRRNRGALVLPPRDDPPGKDPRFAQFAASCDRPTTWACHPVNATYVTRLLDLAESQNIPVFWMLPPIHPAFQEWRDHGYDAARVAYLRGLLPRYSNLTVIDGRRTGYPSLAFADTAHLSRQGAVAFSDAVSGVVRERLGLTPGPDRWVELPRWRDGVAAEIEAVVAVEDLHQTVEAFKRQAAIARQQTAPTVRR